jgi:hypothetical protein
MPKDATSSGGAAWINVTRRTVWERRHDASAISGGFALTAGRFAKRRLRKWRHYRFLILREVANFYRAYNWHL